MGLTHLEPFVGAGPWLVIAFAVPAAGRIIITALALRGTNPKDRPSIIKALAELFRGRWRGSVPPDN
ncbi:hypothetical protein AB0B63_23165 [Micromonospora sp. NPDC049081]|uniref:hypothetical protein n=1 Tax=Micromonospora sp. NPDC049081 TaxID=3155150 RepID=UPI00340ECBAC